MDFTFLYVLGALSAVHLLIAGLTGRSIERSSTTDRERDPRRFQREVAISALCVAVALIVAAVSWVASLIA